MNASLDEVQKALKSFAEKLNPTDIRHLNADGIVRLDLSCGLVLRLGSTVVMDGANP